ncbi:lysophospholipid acyltransferase family protein [Tenacibaculum finnmarkense]|uniref:Acyl-phosphate glycerol 3-phosphate acyltransferase n=1 Tax=Tenacibaculum finnmarkense genomovar ulcerans TaxID=2781388 RepID=A0A2I2LD52_9FLAO|nr:lysophospholipid acyltransferase family protein [Tenacibaculum finnmarkense]MBE7696793.1 1-acyl-sn-glycerol-3-phosphate acyltransferase [Tenacibaculum finnmarkense genomovar ulcerans]SOS58137.1 Acyl-phosphate glycerol 3-phosphate acyltransferase [Tenacibaculum finnmarkense genomovar ulcerans]
MKYILFPFRLIWRVWFYLLMIVSVLVIAPFVLVLLSDEKYYGSFWKLMRAWSFFLIYAMGFRLKFERQEAIDSEKSYIFIANHTSLLDPWIMIASSKNPILFVGKKELSKVPLFGFFYKKAVIMVDRSDPNSRKKVYARIKKRLDSGLSIAIYPEGLVPTEEVVLAPFMNGAFNLAIQYEMPIVPQVYFDAKRLFSWDIFKGHPGVFRVKQLPFIQVEGLAIKDRKVLNQQAFDLLENELLNDKKYMKDTNLANNERKIKS